jgi:hypothetical protein
MIIISNYNKKLKIDCTGPFGLCTQEDKDRLGYLCIKKLHENIDDDRDGHVEIHETKEVDLKLHLIF